VTSRDPRAALGEIIRRQRELAALPMRQLASLAGISGPYLSQIEHGLRAPSEAVVDSIARTLHTTAEALYEQAGSQRPGGNDEEPAVLAAVRDDPLLTGPQRQALTEIYHACLAANRVRGRRR
jgi:transcriptional regulator with XRE-family HTH domain